MFDEFLKNFRKMLGGPTSVVGGVAKEAAKQEKTPQKVWGFEEDKANYSDGKKFEDLNWRDVVARNNDTGQEFKFSVGYDQDGKIAGAKTKIDDKTSRGYIGKDSVSNFFRSNFDRDATDYSIFDDRNDGNRWLIFGSKHDGAFIPSYALGSNRRSQLVPVPEQRPDKPITTLEDSIDDMRRRQASNRGMRYVQEDEGKAEPAWNGTIVPWRKNPAVDMNQYESFANGRNVFDKMVAEWTLEDDPRKRQDILKKYDDQYGFADNIIFNGLLEQLSWHDYGDENDHDHPGAKFDIIGRMDWLKDIRRQMDDAELQYNPYKKA